MKFRKIILIFTVLATVSTLFGCQKQTRLQESLSRLREDVYVGESENYRLTVYPELRESPMISDGKISQLKNVVILKLQVKNGLSGEFTVSFSTDKTYEETFSFSAFSDCYVSSIEVEKLPDKPIIVTICHDEETETINTLSQLKSSTITYTAALNAAYKAKKDYLDEKMQNGVFGGEIYLRLIAENDKNYWFVGFITEKGTLCLLLSDSGALLEERSLPPEVK